MSVVDPAETVVPQPRSPAITGRDARAADPSDARIWHGLPAEAPATARLAAAAAAALLGCVLPVLMVVANKSAPAVLGAAALAAHAAALTGGRASALARRYRNLLATPLAGLVIAVVLACALSLAWTVDRGITRRGLVEGLPELVFALGLAAAWPLVSGPRDARWLVGGVAAAGGLILFEHLAGMPLHALVRARGEAWDLKRSAIPPLLLLWPAAALCWPRRRAIVAALVASVAAGAAASHSGAPAAALACGAVLFAVALRAPRAALAFVGAILVALVLTAPWTGTVLSRALPPEATATLREEHAEHRLSIWHAFQRRGFDRPLLGHGFDASFKVAESARRDGAPVSAEDEAIVGFHPHDVMLQFWVELGALGLALASVVFCFVMGRLARRRGAALAARLGLLASVLGVGLVGLSAWQAWWLASIAASLLWLAHADAAEADPAG